MLTQLINRVPMGVRFMLFSALSFALMSACVKLVSTYHIPVLEIVAGRALVSLVISYVDVKRKGLSVWGHDKRWLFARGAAGTAALMCVYYAVTTLPLAEATILQYMNPVFTALLALIFLKESIQKSTVLCVIFSLIGLAIIVSPAMTLAHATQLPLLSVGIALLGAFGSAVAYVIVRKLSAKEDSSVIIFYFPLVALPISLALLGNDFVIPEPEALGLLILIGIFTQGGQLGLTQAMRSESASKAMAYSYVQVVFSVILGWLMFREVPTIWTWLGGMLIVSGALINAFGHSKKRTL